MYSKSNIINQIALAIILLLIFAGCSSKKTCSADTQCNEGSFCGNNSECINFKTDDYTIAFENLNDGQLVTTADDVDRSKDGIQIDIPVKINDSGKIINDGTSIILSVTAKGEVPVLYFGSIIKDRTLFSLVKIPFGEVKVAAYLAQNPAKTTEVTLNSKNISIDLYYLKTGNSEFRTLLDNAIIVDEDDFDKITSNGIQLSISASSTGLEQGDAIKIFIPEYKEEVIAEAVVDEKGNAEFNVVDIPAFANIRMSVSSGKYSRNIDFSVDSDQHCGFIVNLENDQIFGIQNDENTNLSGLQYDLAISDIAGCGSGSKVSIYIDKEPGEGITPDNSFYTASNSAQERITLQKSKNPNDKRKVFILVEDGAKGLSGSASFSGIIVDLDAPLVETTYPQAGQTLNMSDDIDADTPGLQIKITGNASDDITSPVTVYVKVEDTVISEQSVSDGNFEADHSFSQSSPTMMLHVIAVDGAGNSSESSTPFTVSIDTGLKFMHICGREGTQIIDGLWLNHSADMESETEGLQCTAILQVDENSGIDEISLKVGDGEIITKVVSNDNTAEFDLSLADTDSGIVLNANAYVDGISAGQNSITVRVDTIPPVVTLTNDLLLNNGETTSAADMTFNFACSEANCEYNSWLDAEINHTYSTTDSRTVTGLANGNHVFKARAQDIAGNVGNQTVFNWSVDTVAPETTIISNPGSGSANDFALFTFESSKSGSTFQCRLEKEGSPLIPDDGTWEQCNNGKRDYYGLENGNYRFLVRAEDATGNIDPSPAEHVWVIGTEAPVTTITGKTPSDSVTNSTAIVFTFEATVESTFSCRLMKDGSVQIDWTDCSSKNQTYSLLTDGSYVFEVKATALYGVEENTPATYGWAVDTVLPKIKFGSKPAENSPFDSGSFTFECTGETEPCVIVCTLDGNPVDCSAGNYSYSSLSGGSHRFIVAATDTAGNESIPVTDISDEFLNDYTWEIDPAALGVQITATPDMITGATDAEFEFTSNKAAAFECKLDLGNYEICTSPKNYTGLEDGEHTFTVKASFGGDSAENSFSWTVDTTDPVITISNAPENPTFQTGATFAFSANEIVTFECKLSTSSTWIACTSPKIYPTNTFGVAGTEQTYTFEIRATDQAGNTSSISHTWLVDLAGPAIEWISPEPDTNGKIVVTKAADIYPGDPNIYAINIKVKISGSDIGKPINVTGFKTPPGYTALYVTATSPKEYTLTLGLQDGAKINNPLTITVEDNSGNVATLNKVVIVNTIEPTITWASPEDGYKFISGTPTTAFVFNVWNSDPETVVDLIDADTGLSVASKNTVGIAGESQEYVTINPSLPDRCTPYKLYATFYDTLSGTRYYTNSTSDFYLKSTRNITVDKTKIVIGAVNIPGVDGTDRILNRDDNLNTDPDGGMQADISASVSDAGNSSDNQKTVKVFTDNGSGAGASIPLSTLNGISDEADFIKLPLGEYSHTIRIQATDCSGNITSKTLAPITVDSIEPELTLVSPKGSSTNWRWIVFADDPLLGTINGSDKFTNIEMKINSSETLGTYKDVIHTAYNYAGTQLYQNNISSSAVISANSVNIDLPDLEYAKHRFEVTVEDLAGNRKTIGGGPAEVYEVDTIVPVLSFTNVSEGAVFNADMDGGVPGFQIVFQMSVADVQSSSTYAITAVPVLSQGGSTDSSRFTKMWTGTVIADGAFSRSATIGSGWWRISSLIKDGHLNQSSTPLSGGFDIHVSAAIPSIDVLKSTGYDQGEGSALEGTTLESPSWFNPEDIECVGNICNTDIEVWTDAPSGSTAYISLNGGTESSAVTASASGKSFAEFTIALDTSLDYNTLTVRIVSTTSDENVETYYIKVDKTSPGLILLNPAVCSSLPVCKRIDLTDNPLTDVIELAELGFGYEDDSIYGGVLNFKPASSIQFEITGAEEGTVEIEATSGIVNGSTSIEYDSIGGIYYASFENMTVADTNPSGQKNYNLIFKVTETPSGAVTRYLVKLHLELVKPSAINISGKVLTYSKEGKVKIDWVAIQGNNSTYGANPGAVYEYDVRYQDYNDGVCSINTNFETAKKPITTIAGPVPDPMVGEMSYTFYLNRINNGKATSDPLFRESDTHLNGDSYCFAVRAVDAVYAEDGTVLVKNKGSIIQEDKGKLELQWYEIRDNNPKSHFVVLRNLGDLDNDALDDFVISDGYKSSDGINEDYAGNIYIYFTKGEMLFEKTGLPDESLGQGVSSKADFNGDGF
ncbi:MAG TPA: Ig-like domain repeat protein, partial [bacterium]|nr:Ig-like domain repeat protein [bacterium]